MGRKSAAMKIIVCPHCKSNRIITAKVPKDVVVVLPCRSCGELVILFRKKVAALDKRVIEEGTFEERKLHLAEIIAEFLEPGMFTLPKGFASGESAFYGDEEDASDDADVDSSSLPPITDGEQREFVKVHLDQIDNAQYFRKHLG